MHTHHQLSSRMPLWTGFFGRLSFSDSGERWVNGISVQSSLEFVVPSIKMLVSTCFCVCALLRMTLRASIRVSCCSCCMMHFRAAGWRSLMMVRQWSASTSIQLYYATLGYSMLQLYYATLGYSMLQLYYATLGYSMLQLYYATLGYSMLQLCYATLGYSMLQTVLCYSWLQYVTDCIMLLLATVCYSCIMLLLATVCYRLYYATLGYSMLQTVLCYSWLQYVTAVLCYSWLQYVTAVLCYSWLQYVTDYYATLGYSMLQTIMLLLATVCYRLYGSTLAYITVKCRVWINTDIATLLSASPANK